MLAQLKEERRHTGGKVKGMITSHWYRVSCYTLHTAHSVLRNSQVDQLLCDAA
jgi:hypothetical protein